MIFVFVIVFLLVSSSSQIRQKSGFLTELNFQDMYLYKKEAEPFLKSENISHSLTNDRGNCYRTQINAYYDAGALI